MRSLLQTLQEVSTEIAGMNPMTEADEEDDTTKELVDMAATLQTQIRETANRP